jgi:uncharacterized membrane protein (DUF485 family)
MPVNASLQQKGKLGYTKDISIRDGQEIHVRLLAGKNDRSYRVHLLALASKGKAKMHIAWPWLWAVIASVVLLIVYMESKQLLPFENTYIELAIYLACAVGVILGLVMTILKLSLKRVYTSRIAKVPILEFDINKPDRKSYRSFVDALEEHIQKMHSAYSLKTDQQLAGEIRTLRRLLQDGVVSQAAYNGAKAKILKN